MCESDFTIYKGIVFLNTDKSGNHPEKITDTGINYFYLGDKLTDEKLKGQRCRAIKKNNKCIRAGSKMLVSFGNVKHVILVRRLRKINN
ncbi:MAG TPA: hypothetical protein VGB37_08605 [Candidatus Lokiarchaeia archaeon]